MVVIINSTVISMPETLQFRFQRLNLNLKARRVSSITNSHPRNPSSSQGDVFVRLQRLVSEFQSLREPIDRVKKLLDYATAIPRLSESTRSPENRVARCAALVWLEVEMKEFWRMRFGADSGSEIIKGSSCFRAPQQVMMVKAEDLEDTNIGLPVRSRVNSWHNLLRNMQERTGSL